MHYRLSEHGLIPIHSNHAMWRLNSESMDDTRTMLGDVFNSMISVRAA